MFWAIVIAVCSLIVGGVIGYRLFLKAVEGIVIELLVPVYERIYEVLERDSTLSLQSRRLLKTCLNLIDGELKR